MAEDLVSTLRYELSNSDAIALDGFGILRRLSLLVNDAQDHPDQGHFAQELVLRALAVRGEFGPAERILAGLVRRQGLFPYLDQESLGFADSVALELNKPYNLEGDIVFHAAQTRIYDLLLSGQNVVLSAPTSFGKSLIIDAMIATGKYENIVVVVPTIALIDETRRRLFEKFGSTYKIITHLGQAPRAKNIYVFTQERVVEFSSFGSIDFFVIDEFYKLDPRSDPERAGLLNEAFYRLLQTRAQFYLLGPSIQGLPEGLPAKFECVFVRTDYATVVSEVHRVQSTRLDRSAQLVGLCNALQEPTLVYCASPASARRVATALVAGSVGTIKPELEGVVNWVGEEFDPEWVFVKALERGIGIHHGRMPRALAQYVVRAFNEGLLDYLICTSTLIEGVNTKAKNVVIYDNKIARKNFDFFTFNNIKGRSGRMGVHYIGSVYLFNDPPQEDFPDIEVPLLTQGDSASNSLLIQLDEVDLTESAKERLSAFRDEEQLPLAVLRENRGIDPESQVTLARDIRSQLELYAPLLTWKGSPSYDQLVVVCMLIWEYLVEGSGMRAGVASGKQLAFRLNRFRSNPNLRVFIQREVAENDDPDEGVEGALEFVRYWATYNFPRYLMAIDRIQRSVLGTAGIQPGDYRGFAVQLENCFVPAGIAALDEYGIPIQVGQKISDSLGNPDNLDTALERLRQLSVEELDLSPFERELVVNTQRYV